MAEAETEEPQENEAAESVETEEQQEEKVTESAEPEPIEVEEARESEPAQWSLRSQWRQKKKMQSRKQK